MTFKQCDTKEGASFLDQLKIQLKKKRPMMAKLKRISGKMVIAYNVDCPHCSAPLDVFSNDVWASGLPKDMQITSIPISGVKVSCMKCLRRFIVIHQKEE